MESPKQIPSEESFKDQVETVFAEVIKMPEVSEALDLLDGLPERLSYHSKGHTFDVLKETILFALADGADKETIRQQAVSAAWHDVGYLERDEQNEPVAVEMFKKSKAFQVLSEEQRNEVVANIMDTQMVMKDDKPFLLKQDSKFGYILDGDVSNFGRKDYFEKRAKVVKELGLDLSNIEARKKFYAFAIELMKNHEWKTDSARALRQAQKEINLKRLEDEFAGL
jgi:hypothetical protein